MLHQPSYALALQILPCSHRHGAAPPLRRRSDLGCAGRVGVPDAHSAAHLATLARPAQHASRVQSARWPMCRVHTARPCTPPQGVDTPQLRRPLRGVCEAIVVRTHHDDRATATPSEAATGARWLPKGGLPRRLLRHGRRIRLLSPRSPQRRRPSSFPAGQFTRGSKLFTCDTAPTTAPTL